VFSGVYKSKLILHEEGKVNIWQTEVQQDCTRCLETHRLHTCVREPFLR